MTNSSRAKPATGKTAAPTRGGGLPAADPVYGTSRLKAKRVRRTRAELGSLDYALYNIVREQQPVTVRGIFYQAEVRALVPKTEAGYDVVQRRVLAMRRTGSLPWAWVTDGTRLVRRLSRWDGVRDFANHAASFYRRDYWVNSPVRVEIWVEKDALAGTIFPVVVEEWGIELFVARGFSSATYLQNAGAAIADDGRPTHVYVLGDFDPSGLCASDKVAEELPAFAPGVDVKVTHLAVNTTQIKEWGLPTRDVKRSDSRAPKFIQKYGEISVELDAIPPNKLRSIVGEAIARHADLEAIERLKMIEREERESIAGLWTERGGRS